MPKPLTLAPAQSFEADAYYTWFYDGSSLSTILGGVAMVVIMLAAVMFPLWPASLRLGVWYLSVGVLCLIGAFIVLAIVRLIGWGITSLLMKHGIWLFPNLFEDVGFVSSAWPYPRILGGRPRYGCLYYRSWGAAAKYSQPPTGH